MSKLITETAATGGEMTECPETARRAAVSDAGPPAKGTTFHRDWLV
jgi:hypothetical protein